MKKFLYIILFLFTLNCSINKVSNVHGIRSIDNKFDKIKLNITNKNDLRKIIGPPSSISKFEDAWFFIERRKTNQSLFKLGKKKLSRNNILMVQFENGVVTNKQMLDVNDMEDLKILQTKSKNRFNQDNAIYNIMSTLREKINAPTRRKNNGGP